MFSLEVISRNCFLKYQLYDEELIRLIEEKTNSKIPQQLFLYGFKYFFWNIVWVET